MNVKKRRKGKKRKDIKQTAISGNANYSSQILAPEVKKNKNPFFAFLKKFWFLIAAVALAAGLVVDFDDIKRIFKTNKEKYEEENFISGKLTPPKIENKSDEYSILEHPPIFTNAVWDTLNLSDSIVSLPEITGILLKKITPNDYVYLVPDLNTVTKKGMIMIPIYILEKGISLNLSSSSKCTSQKILMGIKDGRLYVSLDFKDLQKEEIIGSIEYNHWKLFKPNLLDFKNDDSRLQVRDRQGNIVFTLSYVLNDDQMNCVFIGGYFIDTESIAILTNFAKSTRYYDTCYSKFDSLWKQKASKTISKLRPIF